MINTYSVAVMGGARFDAPTLQDAFARIPDGKPGRLAARIWTPAAQSTEFSAALPTEDRGDTTVVLSARQMAVGAVIAVQVAARHDDRRILVIDLRSARVASSKLNRSEKVVRFTGGHCAGEGDEFTTSTKALWINTLELL